MKPISLRLCLCLAVIIGAMSVPSLSVAQLSTSNTNNNTHNCKCGTWGPIKVTTDGATHQYPCGQAPSISVFSTTNISLSPTFTCVGQAPCTATYKMRIDNHPLAALASFTLPVGGHSVCVFAYCNGVLCDSCCMRFVVEKPACDCKGGGWHGIQVKGIGPAVTSGQCGQTFNISATSSSVTVSATYVCNPSTCPPTFQWRLNNGPLSNPPATFTPSSPSTTYTVWLYATCGGHLCDSCKVIFKTK